MGDYYFALKCLAELIGQPLIAPPITKKTIELGCKYSPESVCIPFKYNLGNYIEALEAGADYLFQAGGGCRFGYYGEMQEHILRRLGYKFDFVKLTNNYGIIGLIKNFKQANPQNSYAKIAHRIAVCLARIRTIDWVAEVVRRDVGFQAKPGQMEAIYKKFLVDISNAYSIRKALALKKQYLAELARVELNKPADRLRVGVVGELYMLMEPFSNFYLEKKLAQRNIEVHRFVTVSGILTEYFTGDYLIKKHIKDAKPYLRHHIGSHGTESVARAHELVKKGFDGIIHLKPFGCMPEVSAMSALSNISKDHNVPVLYFSFDSQTSEAGVETRIEAFCDMLYMKKNSKKHGSK